MTLTDERVARWKGWIEGPIHNDIIGMHHKRQIWRDVIGMVEANPEVANTPSAFWDWMREPTRPAKRSPYVVRPIVTTGRARSRG